MSAATKILATTDQHLGYENSQVDDFKGFLEYVARRSDVGTLVVLGDFVDMWRRDVSGLFLETREIVDQLVALGSQMKVCFIVGNHDYHLRELEDHGYPFQFLESMNPIVSGSASCRFMHGWEFDLAQQPPVMEALCYNLSDDAGHARTEVYDVFEKAKDDLGDLFKLHGGQDQYLSHLLQTPETRLASVFPDVEQKAYDSLRPGELLVFGHTHRPFVSTDGRLANAGSWVSDAPTHDTFVEIDGGQVRLFVFGTNGVQEITERKTFGQAVS